MGAAQESVYRPGGSFFDGRSYGSDDPPCIGLVWVGQAMRAKRTTASSSELKSVVEGSRTARVQIVAFNHFEQHEKVGAVAHKYRTTPLG